MLAERQTRVGSAGSKVPRSRWRMLFAVVPCLTLTEGDGDQHPVPMRDVAIRGRAHGLSREVNVVLRARIATPIGKIPIDGHMRLLYDCTSAFTAKVSYNPFVRFFAKLKRVDLITEIDGRVQIDSAPPCPTMDAQRILGRAEIEVTQLSGWLNIDNDSLAFRGPAWMMGDSSYHALLAGTHRGRRMQMSVNMYER